MPTASNSAKKATSKSPAKQVAVSNAGKAAQIANVVSERTGTPFNGIPGKIGSGASAPVGGFKTALDLSPKSEKVLKEAGARLTGKAAPAPVAKTAFKAPAKKTVAKTSSAGKSNGKNDGKNAKGKFHNSATGEYVSKGFAATHKDDVQKEARSSANGVTKRKAAKKTLAKKAAPAKKVAAKKAPAKKTPAKKAVKKAAKKTSKR